MGVGWGSSSLGGRRGRVGLVRGALGGRRGPGREQRTELVHPTEAASQPMASDTNFQA